MRYELNPNISINETLKNAHSGDIIYLKDGIYHEKVEIFTNNIQIIGESKENTIISNNDHFYKIMPDGNECNTFRTYTVLVKANNVSIENITIENTSVPSKKYGQAVALSVLGTNFTCKECIIKGAQDTLFTGPMPDNIIERYSNTGFQEYLLSNNKTFQKYTDCIIEGDVDFIFGGATALFENCVIKVLKRNEANNFESNSYISAPSHTLDIPYGYLFYKCQIICPIETKGVYLSRPWRDYGCAAYILCEMTNNINPLGFNKWNNTNRDQTARYYEYSENLDLSNREPWVHELNKLDAAQYVIDFMKYFNDNFNN